MKTIIAQIMKKYRCEFIEISLKSINAALEQVANDFARVITCTGHFLKNHSTVIDHIHEISFTQICRNKRHR